MLASVQPLVSVIKCFWKENLRSFFTGKMCKHLITYKERGVVHLKYQASTANYSEISRQTG